MGGKKGASHVLIDSCFEFEHSAGMPRQACVVIPGLPHHVITHGGNNREDVFLWMGTFSRISGLLHE